MAKIQGSREQLKKRGVEGTGLYPRACSGLDPGFARMMLEEDPREEIPALGGKTTIPWNNKKCLWAQGF